MTRIFISPVIFFFCFSLLPTDTLHSSTRGVSVTSKNGQSLYLYKSYHALVVGVSDYERWPKLPNAVRDAKEVAARLREMQFDVNLLLNPTSRELKTAMGEMVYEMGREENRALIFYFAGHGATETLADKTKMGYIVPRDSPLLGKDPMGFAAHAISMREIESASLRIKAKHVLMLFDSCFSGSLFALVRAVPHDITEKSALPVRQYITAGREDEVVPDRSMFKRSLLIGLEGDADLTGDGYITGTELGMYLSNKVVNYTHRQQHPQYGKINNPDLDRGDFIFVPLYVQEMEMVKGKDLKKEKSERDYKQEMLFWESIKDSEDPSMYREYLKKYPNGTFSGLARLKEKRYFDKSASIKTTKTYPDNYRPKQYKTAIFPSYFLGRYHYTSPDEVLELMCQAIRNFKFLSLTNSFYDINNEVKTISENEIEADRVWKKEKYQKVPNKKYIIEVARKLNIDLVFTFETDMQDGMSGPLINSLRVFLIDIKNDKILSEKYIMGALGDINSVTNKLILKYKNQIGLKKE